MRSCVSDVSVALKSGQRPTAMITRFRGFGHTDPFTGLIVGNADDWIDWDYALASAWQLHEDMIDVNRGLPIHHIQSKRVKVVAELYTDKIDEAIDKAQAAKGENWKPKPGQHWIPRLKTVDGGELPTLEEFFEEQEEKTSPSFIGDNSRIVDDDLGGAETDSGTPILGQSVAETPDSIRDKIAKLRHKGA